MSNVVLLVLVLSLFFVWNGVLTFVYFKAIRHYSRLRLSNEKTLYDSFEQLFSDIEKLGKHINDFEKRIRVFEDFKTKPLQKVHMMRFNPYGDVGGDQSFCAALLDGGGTGLVFSSLHGRSTTRIYAKPVVAGKPDKYELSDEESQVVKLTLGK